MLTDTDTLREIEESLRKQERITEALRHQAEDPAPETQTFTCRGLIAREYAPGEFQVSVIGLSESDHLNHQDIGDLNRDRVKASRMERLKGVDPDHGAAA